MTRHDPPVAPTRFLTKVPEISGVFWALKVLTTGMGESMSDFLAHHSIPLAAFIGIVGIVVALRLQLGHPEYSSPRYWFTVMMVAVFGTMVADGIHRGLGIGYAATTPFFALVTAAVFAFWYRSEGTLSIHTINAPRREYLYWAAVLATFALGTAAGDLTAFALGLGFWASVVVFAAIISIPAFGWLRLGWSPIFCFWFAYVVTRPLGASIADGFGKPYAGGLGIGDGPVSIIALLVFVAMVTWVTVTGRDLRGATRLAPAPRGRRAGMMAAEPE